MYSPRSASLPLLVAVMITWVDPCSAAWFPDPDRIVVIKHERVLRLEYRGDVLKSYPIALGRHWKGAKREKGDGRTPEGVYLIDGRTRVTPYHLALHLSYPNAADRARAGGRALGGAIFIHGMPARFGRTDPVRFFVDWTNGCISVGNHAIEEIWDVVADGTAVEIRP